LLIRSQLSTYLQRGVLKEKFANDKQRTPEAFAPHSEFVMQARDTYGDMRKQLFSPSPAFEQTEDDDNQGDCGQSNDNSRIRGDESDPVDERDSEETAVASSSKRHKSSQSESSSKSRKPQSQDNGSARSNEPGHLKEGENRIQDDFDRIQDDPESKGKRTEDVEGGKTDEADQQLEVDLLKQLMDRMVQLEAEARQMLLDAMEEGVARTLLLADRNGAGLSP